MANDPLIGTVISGRFTVQERLGNGGMGVVYRGVQHMGAVTRPVALKVLLPQYGEHADAARRFENEARAASSLTNGHTVHIYDFGAMEDGSLYIAMQLLEGETLAARLRRGPLAPRSAVLVALQVAESLAEAHAFQPPIIHRDIKPDNVFIRDTTSGEPHVTVLDFGMGSDLRLTSEAGSLPCADV